MVVRTAKEVGLSNVCFSIDGLEQIHDEIRREGSFRRSMSTIPPSVSMMTSTVG